jgi:hypothetical protein
MDKDDLLSSVRYSGVDGAKSHCPELSPVPAIGSVKEKIIKDGFL